MKPEAVRIQAQAYPYKSKNGIKISPDCPFYTLIQFDREPKLEPKLQYTGSGSGQKFRLLADPAPAPQHWLLAKLGTRSDEAMR